MTSSHLILTNKETEARGGWLAQVTQAVSEWAGTGSQAVWLQPVHS